jgi:hypothetical protein
MHSTGVPIHVLNSCKTNVDWTPKEDEGNEEPKRRPTPNPSQGVEGPAGWSFKREQRQY